MRATRRAAYDGDMADSPTVDDFMRALSHPLKPEIERVRRSILGSLPGVTEHVKWNAPSFCIEGDDRVTFNLQRGRLVIVFHRGARPMDAAGFSFDETTGLIDWRSPDRGVMTFTSASDVVDAMERIADVARRWMTATSGARSATSKRATAQSPPSTERSATKPRSTTSAKARPDTSRAPARAKRPTTKRA